MRWIVRRIPIFAVLIVDIVLAYTDNAAPPGRSPPSGYANQQLNNRPQSSGYEGEQQENNDVVKDKIINNVYIQVFLNTKNGSVENSNVRTNGFLYGANLLTEKNAAAPLGSQKNPIAFRIDLEKGTVSEVANNNRDGPSAIINESAATRGALEPIGKTTAIVVQNPHETSDSLLRDDSAPFYAKKQDPEVTNFQAVTVPGTEKILNTFAQTAVQADPTNPNKESVTESLRWTATTDRAGQLPKEIEKALSGEIGPSTQSRLSDGALAVADKSSLDTDLDETIDEAALDITKEETEISTPSTTRTFTPSLSSANTFRYGKLASSHILDYSRFSTKAPPADITTLVPGSEPISSFFDQTPTTTAIPVADKEILSEQLRPLIDSQQSFKPTSTFAPETFGKLEQSDRITTASIQTVGFPSTVSQSSQETISFQTAVTSSESNAESSASVDSGTILPLEPLITPKAYPLSTTTTPELVIFKNKTARFRTTIDVSSEEVTLKPGVTAEPQEEEITVIPDTKFTKETVHLPKVSLKDGASVYQVVTIPIGDREILEEQMQHLEDSSHRSTPHIAVGEQISEMQETHPRESSMEHEFSINPSNSALTETTERQATLTSSGEQKSDTVKNIQSTEKESTEVSLQKPSESGASPGDEMLPTLPKHRGTTISSQNIATDSEEDFTANLPDYLQPVDSTTPESAVSVTDSGHEPEKSGVTTSASTQLPDMTELTALIQPPPSLNPSTFDVLNDEAKTAGSETRHGFTISQTTPSERNSQITNQVEVSTSVTEIPTSGSIRIGDKSAIKENLEMHSDGQDEGYQHTNSFSTGVAVTSASSDSTTEEPVESSLSRHLGKELEKEIGKEEERTGSLPIATEVITTAPNKITTAGDLGEAETSEPSYCEIVAANGGECPEPNDKSDRTRSDILFLIDASSAMGEAQFQQALKIIKDAVQQFRNIGPDGVQISLVQFAREPVLEFSFRKHNCKPCLLADIADTKYMNGVSNLGNAIQKAAKYGFSKRRGDRDDAQNILVVISDGMSDDRLREPFQLLGGNNMTVMVVSTKDANPKLIKQLVNGDRDNLFNITATGKSQVADQLAERVRTVAQEKSPNFGTTVAVEHDESIRGFGAQCLSDGFNVTFTLLKSFGGIIAVRGKAATEGCSKVIQAEQFGDNIATREVNLFINFRQCDVEETVSTHPAGMNYSVVVNVMHDKWLVTGADKGFLLQCYRSQQPLEQDLNTGLNIHGGIKIAETLPLSSVPPLCNYTIRKDTPNGPLVQSTSLGDVIYHRWECESDHQASDTYGLHIHDCYAESDSKQQHVFIDNKGCSADANIIDDVVYADDQLVAFAHAKVFTFTDSEHLSFHCKLSLCTRKADGCEGITPPQCPRSGRVDLLVYRRARHSTESFLAALTTEEEAELTLILPVNTTDSAFSLETVDQLANANLFWLMLILTTLSVIVALMLIRYINKLNGSEESTDSEYSQKHEVISHVDYITAVASLNSKDFLPIEKTMDRRTDMSYNGLLGKVPPEAGSSRDGELKIETVSVNLNPNYEEIRPHAKHDHDSLYSTISTTESLRVELDPT